MRHSHIASLVAAFAVLAACNNDVTSPLPRRDPDEIVRGDYQLLVERYSRAGERSFYSMDANGGFLAPLTGVPGDAQHIYPSPDGRTIAYLRLVDDLTNIWLMNRDGTNRRPLVTGERVIDHVSWAPDGRQLVFGSTSIDESPDIWVVRADGTNEHKITRDEHLPAVDFDYTPEWSPNGNKIVFVSSRTGITRLWTMNPDGSGLQHLIPTTIEGTQRTPAWSADGEWIAFTSGGAEGPGIGIVRQDGTGYRTFPLPFDAGRPAWLPDGRVLYSAHPTGDYELYALDINTGASTRLTNHRDHDYRAVVARYVAPPAWRGFAIASHYPTSSTTDSRGLAAGDLDADGIPDIAILGADGDVRILRGRAEGVFERLGSLTGAAELRMLTVGNLSLDRSLDIAALGTSELFVWRGHAGGPGLPDRHSLVGDGKALAVADFDSDGKPDIATIEERAGSGFHLVIRSNRPDDVLIPIVDGATPFNGARRACAADITGGGTQDLAVLTTSASAPLILFPGRGDISFEAPRVVAGVRTTEATLLACADVTGDGRADVLLLEPGAGGGLTILPSTGSAFAAARSFAVRGDAMAAADVDRDGDVDVIVASGSSLLFLRNLGDGTLADAVTLPVGGAATPRHVTVADLDGDLWPDIAVGHANGTVSVMLNRGA